MAWPHLRMRITLGELLVGIVIIALNCVVFRQFVELVKSDYTDYETAQAAPFLLGSFLLLPNVVLIGILLFVVRLLRGVRRPGTPGPRPSSIGWGIWFSSFHFLLLGVVAAVYIPDIIPPVVELSRPLVEGAIKWWASLSGSENSDDSRLVFATVIPFFTISVPLLLLSVVGAVLTRKSASSLPRCRFRILAGMVSLDFAMVALAIALTPHDFQEDTKARLEIRVVDHDSGRPIHQAFVRVVDTAFFQPETPLSDFTDAGGRVALTARFEAVGQKNAFRTMGLFSPWGRWLEVSAEGYRTIRTPLVEVLQPAVDLENPPSCQAKLRRGKTPENIFEDIAGSYASGSAGLGGSGYAILPDGRFRWTSWGCMGIFGDEFGYLKRDGEKIALLPIPHPGHEPDLDPALNLRITKWDDRLYLSGDRHDHLFRLCRASLTPSPSLARRSCGYYRVESEGEESLPRGYPRLPAKVWISFALDEISLRDEFGLLRVALVSLIPRTL